MFQCQIHRNHYYRKGGKCIECKEQWKREERAQREQDRVKKLDKKAKDTAKADFAIAGNGSRLGAFTKPGKRQSPVPKIKCPEQERGKGKTQGLTLHKAKKKWMD